MIKQHFQVHPNVMIMQKQGRLFAGQLSEKIPPILLQPLDILFLGSFFSSMSIEEVTAEFLSNELIVNLSNQLNAEIVSQRVNQFVEGKLLVESTYGNNECSCNDTCFDDLEKQDKSIDDSIRLKLDRNFALLPVEGGFNLWSSKLRKTVFLAPETAFILSHFAQPMTYSESKQKLGLVIEPSDLRTTISGLFACGALLKASEDSELIQIESQKKNTNQPISSSGSCWEAIVPNGRIPIYFVPHMENHYPLALGMLYSSIESYQSGKLLERFQLIPINYLTPDKLLSGPYNKFGKGIWLFSNYMWSLDTNIQISEAVKQHNSANLTIHGGPSTPNYEAKSKAFFKDHASVDMTVHNEGEIAICEILERIVLDGKNRFQYLSMSEVTGISFKTRDEQNNINIIRNKDRVRAKELDSIPSPYISGVFENYQGRVDAAIIESNRGCPFGCTFCDWGSATSQKVRKFDLERVKKEIEWIAERKVRVLWIADANFGMYDRDIELAEHIVFLKKKEGFPKEIVVNYTKNTTWRLAKIIEIFNQGGIISQGVISIQTTDTQTLEVINRKNIKTNKYDELSEVFNKEKLPLSTDLMIGLPGITVEAFKKDLQRYFDRDVAVKAYPTQLLPNSPMADPEYIKKYQLKTDEQDFLISSFSYTNEDLLLMKSLYKYFTIADGYSVLRYVLRYLQWDLGVPALDFMADLMHYLEEKPEEYPKVRFCFRYFDVDKCMPGGWHQFYQQLKKYIVKKYEISDVRALDCVLKVNEMLMPEESRTYPLTISLEYDISQYFLSNNIEGTSILLNQLPPGELIIDDPNRLAEIDLDEIQYDSHQFFWELHSNVSRAKSIFSS